jgi:hypothetical protein
LLLVPSGTTLAIASVQPSLFRSTVETQNSSPVLVAASVGISVKLESPSFYRMCSVLVQKGPSLSQTELVAFLRLFRQLPSIDEILLNPDLAPLPEEPSARIAIATVLGRALTDHSVARGIRYLDRMPTEMRVLAMRDAAARDRAITHTPEFVRFGVEHAEVLQ